MTKDKQHVLQAQSITLNPGQGTLPKGWVLKKLGEVCQIRPPKSEAKGLLKGSDLVSFVPMNILAIDQKHFLVGAVKPLSEVVGSYTYFRNGDVLLAKITPCFENGKLGIATNLKNSIGFGSSEFIVYRPKKETFSDFIYYYLNQEYFRAMGASQMTGAVGHRRIPKSFHEDFQIPIPPIPEQEKIVAVLDQAFAAIDQAKANIETNLRNAKELFQSRLNDVFSQQGEGWEEKKLGEVCEIKPPKKEVKTVLKEESLVSFVPMKNLGINIQYFIPNDVRKLRDVFSGYTYFKDGDVILAKITPCFENGKLGIAKGLTNGVGFGSSEFVVYRVKDGLLNEFLYHFLNRSTLRKLGRTKMVGAVGHKRIPKDYYEELLISFPSLNEQEKLVSTINKLQGNICLANSLYQQKLAALLELKQSILQKAFAGGLSQ